jgi:hypothetical protein
MCRELPAAGSYLSGDNRVVDFIGPILDLTAFAVAVVNFGHSFFRQPPPIPEHRPPREQLRRLPLSKGPPLAW